MRKIVKGQQPESLSNFKKRNQTANYDDLTGVKRTDIRQACTKEQFYLCAYCCQRISGDSTDTMNEHVEAQRLSPGRSLDYSNIVASCTTKNQCDNAHDSKPFSLTPFIDECETELVFSISGRVQGASQRAIEAISVLNLGDTERNNKALIQKRKWLSNALLFANGLDPQDGLDDEELLQDLIRDLAQPRDGRLEAFAPVTINILRGWLNH